MRTVVHVITDSNIGEAGRSLITFFKHSDRTAYRFIVIMPSGSLLAPHIEELGIEAMRFGAVPAERSFSFPSVKALRRLFTELRPDIVHTHASLSARIAARLYGKCKILHTRHSAVMASRFAPSFPFRPLYGLANNYLSDRIIAVSPSAKASMTALGTNPGKVSIVFNGADAQIELSEGERLRELSKLGLSEFDFVVGCMPRLEKGMGHDVILRAAMLFQAHYPHIRLVIAGTGPEEERLKRIAANERLENVIFTGQARDTRAALGIMKLQLDARQVGETPGLSLLEGMSVGLPAVVSDAGGNPFVIQDGVNGFVVPASSHIALFEGVVKLMTDEGLYRRTRENAIKVFYERFTADVMADGIQAVYRELLNDGEGGEDD